MRISSLEGRFQLLAGIRGLYWFDEGHVVGSVSEKGAGVRANL